MKIFKLKNKFNLKMSSNICHRCRIKSAELTCKACQTSLCFECDDFVHSSLKKNHFREKIKYNSFSELNTNFETNYNFYNNNSPSRFDNNFIEDDKEIDYNINQYDINNKSTVKKGSILQKKLNNISRISQDKLLNTCNSGFNIDEKYNMNRTYNLDYKNKKKNLNERKNNIGIIKDIKLSNITSERNSTRNNYKNTLQIPNLSSRYVNQIKDIFGQEKKNLIIKINNLTQELDTTKKNLTERITYLHKHLYEIENKYETDIREQENNHLLNLKKAEEEKNEQTTKLQNIIKEQNNTINELKTKIKNLENIMTEKENSYLKSNRKIENILNEKDTLENYYKNEIEQMKKKHIEEKESLISEYEHVINQINAELDINKKNYFNALKEIKEKENMIQNVVDNANNEKEQMNNDILKLKEQNNLEQNNLMEINSELKFESENKTEEIEQLKNEIKNLTEENEMMRSKFKKYNGSNYDKKYYNTKINEIVNNTLSKK